MKRQESIMNQMFNEFVKSKNEYLKVEKSIEDINHVIVNLESKKGLLESLKLELEKTKNNIFNFKNITLMKCLKHIIMNTKGLKEFYFLSIINTIIGILVGMVFLPFSLIFVGTFGYIAYLYFEPPIKEFQNTRQKIKNVSIDAIDIKLNWNDSKILEITKQVEILNQDKIKLQNISKQLKSGFEKQQGITNVLRDDDMIPLISSNAEYKGQFVHTKNYSMKNID